MLVKFLTTYESESVFIVFLLMLFFMFYALF